MIEFRLYSHAFLNDDSVLVRKWKNFSTMMTLL
jgi:hypothetical protein